MVGASSIWPLDLAGSDGYLEFQVLSKTFDVNCA